MRWSIGGAAAVVALGFTGLGLVGHAHADESLLGGWGGALVCENGAAFAIDIVFTDASNGAAAGVVRLASENDLRESKARLAPDGPDPSVLILTADSTMDALRLVRDGDRMVGAPLGRDGCSVTVTRWR